MLPLVAKTTLIRAKVTGTPKIIIITNEGVIGQEVKGAKTEVKEAKTSHVRTART